MKAAKRTSGTVRIKRETPTETSINQQFSETNQAAKLDDVIGK